MRLLALDTSTLAGSIALLEDDLLRAEVNMNLGRKHTERLLPGMDWIFSELEIEPAQIEAIAVGIGPGSFTGLRVGLATAKGLALSLEIPIVGVSSLDALAWQVRFYPGSILALIDARKGQLFARFYKGGDGFAAAADPMVVNPAELAAKIPEKTMIVGEGYRAYQDVFVKLGDKVQAAGFEFDIPRASIIGKLGFKRLKAGDRDDPDTLVPVYLRSSDAEYAKSEAK
jgi:tRNA threonylcarbamoyladenosine biosynthesis protein TsaB